MTLYCTLAEAKTEVKAETTVDDTVVLSLIRQVSRRIDAKFRTRNSQQGSVPVFAPYIQTRKIPLNARTVNSGMGILYFHQMLLALTTLTAGTTVLTGTQFELYPPLTPPYQQVRLLEGVGYDWWQYALSSDILTYVTVTGIWGWNRDYANAWMSVDTLSAGITSSATSLTVADIDGANAYGLTPRISAGNLLQIDSEWLEVTATDTATNTATVRRGMNGSTAVLHNSGTAVAVWLVDEGINRACVRQVGSEYAKRGAYDVSDISDVANLVFSADLMWEVKQIIQEFFYEV